MVDFRRCFLAIAALVLAIGCVAPASAQVATFQCIANAAVPPTMRAEGLTELIGDIVLNCTGGVPTPVGTTSRLPTLRYSCRTYHQPYHQRHTWWTRYYW